MNEADGANRKANNFFARHFLFHLSGWNRPRPGH